MHEEQCPRGQPWTRRSLAVVLGAGLGAAVLPLGWLRPARRARLMAHPFRDDRAARVVGRRYLAVNPGEASRPVLLDRLGPLAPAPDRPVEPRVWRHRLIVARTADFAAGDTVLVDGWLLARSEARLCALVALS